MDELIDAPRIKLFPIRPRNGLSLPLETAILWSSGVPECQTCHIAHPEKENARRHSEEHMPPPEEVEMRRLWHLGELVSPSVKRSMVSVALQSEFSLNSGFYPEWYDFYELPFPPASEIRKAVDPSLPPAVAPPVKESAEEKRLKEKVSERDTEIDRLRKEVTSLQDQLRNEVTGLQNQMAGQHQAFQVATETIRRNASQREQELKDELAVEMQEHLDKIPRLEARLRANDIVNNRLVLALALKMQENIAQINALHDNHAARIVQIGLGYTQTLANVTAEHANALANITAEHADALAALNEELTHREVLHGEREQAHIEQMGEVASHVDGLVQSRLQDSLQERGQLAQLRQRHVKEIRKRDDEIEGLYALVANKEQQIDDLNAVLPKALTAEEVGNAVKKVLLANAPTADDIAKAVVKVQPAPTADDIAKAVVKAQPVPTVDSIVKEVEKILPTVNSIVEAIVKVQPAAPTVNSIVEAVVKVQPAAPTVDSIVKEVKKVLPSVPTVDSIVKEVKKVLPSVPTVESIVQEIKKVLPSVPTVDSIVQEVKKVLPSVPTVDSIVQEVKKVLPAGPTAEDIGKAVKIPTAEDIGRAVKVEVPTAEDIGKQVKVPTAEDIGGAVKVEVPTAEAIGKQVKVEVPTADEIGRAVKDEAKVPTAENIAKEVAVKVKVPTAEEIGRAVKVDAEAIGKAVKVDVPTADNIGQAIKLPAAEEIGKAIKCNPQFKLNLSPQMIKDVATEVGEIISAKVISSFADKVVSSGSGVSRDLDEDELQQAIDDLSNETVPTNDIAQAVLEQRFMDGYKDWKGTKERPSLFFVALAQCVQRRQYPGSVFKASLGVAERIVEEGYDMVGEQDPRAASAFVALCSVIRKARTG